MHESAKSQPGAIQDSDFIALVLVKDRRIIWANKAMHRVLGYGPNELIGQPTTCLFPESASYEAFGKQLYEAIEKDQVFSGEFVQSRKDGTAGWFGIYVSRLEGQPDTVVGAIVDCTERYQSVKRLEIEAGILSAMPDSVIVISTDGVIRYTNPAFDSMLGYEHRELIGQNIEIVNADEEHPPGEVAQVIIEALKERGEWQGDVLNRRKDGSIFWTHAKVSTHQRTEWGTVWISVHRDITTQRQAEASLRASEERYRTLVDSTNVLTWTCPPSGLQATPQPAWMAFTGQTADEMLGRGWTNAVHPDDRQSLGSIQQAAMESGQPFLNEQRVRRHDGEWRWMRVRAVPIRNARGQIVEWSGMEQDITEQKRAELALKDNEERLEMALAGSGLVLWDWDIAKREVIAGDRWFDMLGFSPKELGVDEDNWMTLIHPKDVVNFREKLQAHLAGDTLFFHSQHRLRHRNNHWVEVEASGKITHRDNDGRPVRMVGTLLDVTQRKRLNNEGVELLKRIETLIRNLASGPDNNPDTQKTAERLTRRQQEILVHIASGMTSAQIGKRLNLATPTIVSHRRNLMGKLGLHSTAEVTRYAISHGLMGKP